MNSLKRTPKITFQPETYKGLLSGIQWLGNAISPTLGPNPRVVALEHSNRRQQPELLDSGALIARRIVQLEDTTADMGAMLMRQMLWTLHEQTGDGSATASAIFQTIIIEGIRFLTAGGNAQQLKTYLLTGLKLIEDHLHSSKVPIADDRVLSQFVLSVTHDQQLADIFLEVFSTLGAYARIDVRTGYSRDDEREYVQGILWEGGVHSITMLDTTTQKIELENLAIFVSDLEFEDPNALLPIIDVASYQHHGLVIVANKLSEQAIGLINYINQQPKPFKLIAIKLPNDQIEQQDMLEDLAHTVGGRVFHHATGDSAKNVGSAELGQARKIWANQDYFCIVEASQEDNRRNHLLCLEEQYQNAKSEQKARFLRRIGQLMGASATVFIGGFNKDQIRQKKEQVSQYLKVIRLAYEKDLVSGGGTALLTCQSVLKQALLKATSPEEQAAYHILIKAVRTPASQILENAGYYPGVILEQLGTEKFFALDKNGDIQITDTPLIFDSAEVVTRAVDCAIRTAALILTTDVLVHHRNPEFSATP